METIFKKSFISLLHDTEVECRLYTGYKVLTIGRIDCSETGIVDTLSINIGETPVYFMSNKSIKHNKMLFIDGEVNKLKKFHIPTGIVKLKLLLSQNTSEVVKNEKFNLHVSIEKYQT